jgi:hypothetical protein
MSYSKKIIGKEKLFDELDKNISLNEIFSADSIIFVDNFTHEVYKLFKSGHSKEEILKKILK